ncbi:MAG: protein involved in polysaccharide export with SLBB domain [Francisellaceae bacterium]|jgi:protein involved in polysaccharide export with SLBB domain
MYKLIISLILFFVSALPGALAKDTYLLGPGDQLEIKVFNQEALSINVLLGINGSINYPLIGEINVTGLSTEQVEQLIIKGLKGDYLLDPNVYAQIIKYRPFFIHGEVKKPGGYPYQPGMTVNQAVALAGGLTERAARQKIFLSKEGKKNKQLNVTLTSQVSAGDTIMIEQGFF